MDILAVELEVKTIGEKAVRMPLFTGYVARGLALHIMNRISPSLAQDLHEPNAIKPYSVTPLYFRSLKKTPDGYLMDPSVPCSFRIRFLDDSIAKAAMEYFTTSEGTMMIYDTTFKVASLTVRSEDFTKVETANAFHMVFDSPTHLAKIGSKYDQLFPEPTAIFPNLMRMWDRFMPEGSRFGKEVHEKYRQWLAERMTVSGYDLRTVVVKGKSMKIGFVGWCAYRMDGDNDDNDAGFGHATCKLARYAEYSNVGMERTAGFGVVKYFR
jgi:CRISPR-associated endoribonuclease Cas6